LPTVLNSFLGFVQQIHTNGDDEEGDGNDGNDDDNDDDDTNEQGNYTNHRNLCWSINLLRVLQMLTKRKTHRILLLVQYKSSVDSINYY
jgi:hypothetical protein